MTFAKRTFLYTNYAEFCTHIAFPNLSDMKIGLYWWDVFPISTPRLFPSHFEHWLEWHLKEYVWD